MRNPGRSAILSLEPPQELRVVSCPQMCSREGVNLQAVMNVQLGGHYSVVLMSVRPNARYRDELLDDGPRVSTRVRTRPRRAPLTTRNPSASPSGHPLEPSHTMAGSTRLPRLPGLRNVYPSWPAATKRSAPASGRTTDSSCLSTPGEKATARGRSSRSSWLPSKGNRPEVRNASSTSIPGGEGSFQRRSSSRCGSAMEAGASSVGPPTSFTSITSSITPEEEHLSGPTTSSCSVRATTSRSGTTSSSCGPADNSPKLTRRAG